MHLFEWNEDLCLGVDVIDDEHKIFFKHFNTLYEAIQFGKASSVLHSLFDELVTYTVVHFEHEEEYMFTTHFPGFEEHKKAHEELRKTLMAFKERNEDHFSTALANELFAFMKKWLNTHVLGMDRALAEHLKKHGIH